MSTWNQDQFYDGWDQQRWQKRATRSTCNATGQDDQSGSARLRHVQVPAEHNVQNVPGTWDRDNDRYLDTDGKFLSPPNASEMHQENATEDQQRRRQNQSRGRRRLSKLRRRQDWRKTSSLTKGAQQVPHPKSKAKARARRQAMTNEGAEQTPDVLPPRPPPEGPPIVFVRGETLEPSTARPKVRISRKSRPQITGDPVQE